MKPRILIIDDNANQTLVLKTHLGLKGYECTVAGSTRQAKAILSSEEIQLILSDIHLPDGNGSDVLNVKPSLKAIAMSGDTSFEQMDAAKRSGFHAYLIKPFEIDELVQTIDELFPPEHS